MVQGFWVHFIFLSLSVLSSLCLFYWFFVLKQKKIALVGGFMLLVAFTYGILLFADVGNNEHIVLLLHLVPIAIWLFYFIISFDGRFLKGKLRFLTFAFLGGAVLITLGFLIAYPGIHEGFFRFSYAGPLLTLAYLFGVLRYISNGQRRAWLYILFTILTFAISFLYYSSSSLNYFLVVTGVFVLYIVSVCIYSIFSRGTQKDFFFGGSKQRSIKIALRTFVITGVMFVLIFFVSGFTVYFLSKLAILIFVTENIEFQNNTFRVEMNRLARKSFTALEGVDINSRFIDSRQGDREEYLDERLDVLSSTDDSILGLSYDAGDGAREIVSSVDSFGKERYAGTLVGGSQFTFFSDSGYQNPVILFEKEYDYADGTYIGGIFIDLNSFFAAQKGGNEHFHSVHLSFLTPDGGTITYPFEVPFYLSSPQERMNVSAVCADLLQRCVAGEQCEQSVEYFFLEEGFLESDQIVGAVSPIPEYGICSVGNIHESDTVLVPNQWQGISFLFASLFMLFLFSLSSYFFSQSITLPIKNLSENVSRMRRGEFDNVDEPTKDELGELAAGFNELVSELREAKAHVEEKVEERTLELAREKEKVEVIIENVSEGFVFIDKNEKILMLNKAAEAILSNERRNAIGSAYNDVFAMYDEKNPKKKLNILQMMKEKKGEQLFGEGLLETKSKKLLPIKFSTSIVKYQSRDFGVAILFQDVTKEKEIEEIRANFLSIASHQLRSPLSAIKWVMEMLLHGDAGELSKEQLEYVQDAYQSNDRMLGLVSELLKVSRLESGKISAKLETVAIKPVIEKVLSDQKSNAKKQQCVLRLDIKDDALAVLSDPTMFENIIENFVTNAIDYSPSDAESLIVVHVHERRGQVIVSVKDNGIGISDEDQKKIFTMFYRGNNAIEQRPVGTGLGLFIAKMMAEMSGGKIWFESIQGVGSEFFVSFKKA